MYQINQIADYVILRLSEGGDKTLNSLKLQKLLYYIQSWHLAFHKKPIIQDSFQAWVHGPVNREVFDRFKDRMLFFPIIEDDILDKEISQKISDEDKLHIDLVLESYSKFSGVELEQMTHGEEPWLKARSGFRPNERCEVKIDEILMGDYYRSRLQ
jgi:uncharacterized phage-associated protein